MDIVDGGGALRETAVEPGINGVQEDGPFAGLREMSYDHKEPH
jgi:hypothetical protein